MSTILLLTIVLLIALCVIMLQHVVISKLRQQLVRRRFDNWLDEADKPVVYRSSEMRFNPN